jgi:hypothetical protein
MRRACIIAFDVFDDDAKEHSGGRRRKTESRSS